MLDFGSYTGEVCLVECVLGMCFRVMDWMGGFCLLDGLADARTEGS